MGAPPPPPPWRCEHFMSFCVCSGENENDTKPNIIKTKRTRFARTQKETRTYSVFGSFYLDSLCSVLISISFSSRFASLSFKNLRFGLAAFRFVFNLPSQF